MLYLSTRDRTASFTANRALQEDRTPDGGLFVPMQLPEFSEEEIERYNRMSFMDAVASILNLFFGVDVSGWDLGLQVGRSPSKLFEMNHRMMISQLWHNHGSDYCFLEQSIYKKIGGQNIVNGKLPNWAAIAIRIAILFGIFADLKNKHIDMFDVAVPAGEFTGMIAAWYARKMGLPIGKIICGCNDNGGIWDLIHRGEFNTGAAAIKTKMADLDIPCPSAVERLIFDSCGRQETERYVSVCQKRGLFTVQEENIDFCRDMFAAVVSEQRMESVIKSAYRTNRYVMDPYAAVAFGALQDYRARTGESRLTLILADRSPMLSVQTISRILNCSADVLNKQISIPKE